jgi:hypothetical protein
MPRSRAAHLAILLALVGLCPGLAASAPSGAVTAFVNVQFLGESSEIGTTAAGRRAGLVLVPTDPLADRGALAAPKGVMLRGVWRPVVGER